MPFSFWSHLKSQSGFVPSPILNIIHLGQRYNKDGILTQWWTTTSQNAFNQRKQCFVKQYSEYDFLGEMVQVLYCYILWVWSCPLLLQVDGQRTLGENIADNGGLKTAFQVCTYINSINFSNSCTLIFKAKSINIIFLHWFEGIYYSKFAQSMCCVKSTSW